MDRTKSRRRPRRVSLAVFLPVLFLFVLVPTLMSTGAYAVYGLYAIFVSFLGGLVATALSVSLIALRTRTDRTTTSLFVLGISLTLGAALLYLIFGCVFGCPA